MSIDARRPWMDDRLTAQERADLLVPRLCLDQKLAQLGCYFPRDITTVAEMTDRHPHGIGVVAALEARAAVTRDDVTAFQRAVQEQAMAASGHGIPAIFHMEGFCGAYVPGATSFPSGLARGAGWDVDLERSIGEVVGRQERALGITHTFAPVLDVSRDPRLGRHGESYGEDPTLVAALGSALTWGLQQTDDAGRHTEAVAKHFVGSHQPEGGIHGAGTSIAPRLLMEMYAKPFQAAITEAGLRGIMPAYNALDGEPMSSSRRMLTDVLRGEMGFDGLIVSDYGAIGNLHTVQRVAPTAALAGLAALEAGMDVEQHVPNGFAEDLRELFADGRADISLLDRAVREVLRAKFRMGLFENPFAPAVAERDRSFGIASDADLAVRSARESLVLLRNDGALPLRPDVTKVVVIGCHAASARFFFGGYTHFSMAEGLLAANASMAGLAAKGDVRTIVRTIPGTTIEASDDAAYEDLLQRQQPGIHNLLDELRERMPHASVQWARGYPFAGDDDSGHDEALALAADADVVILTLGGKHGTSSIASIGEGIDATDITLPPCQDELIVKLAALGTPLIGVHLDGRPVSSDAADAHLNALLEAWSPAEGGAQAIVDVLTGMHAPSGKLPVSVARNAGQVPIYYNHPRGSSWHQGDSVGFADYVDAPHTPRYPFGHGLSYTRFEYDTLELSATEVLPDETVRITVEVTNAGEREGTEIVQLYASDAYASVARPVKELAGFRRVTLVPGQSETVEFTLDVSQLAFLDSDMRWRIEAGEVEIEIGASSEDIRLTGILTIRADAVIDGARRAFFA